MRRRITIYTKLRFAGAALLVAAAVPLMPAHHAEPIASADTSSTGRLVVEMKPGATDADLAGVGRVAGGAAHWNSAISRSETEIADIELPPGADAARALERIRHEGHVAAADYDHLYRLPEDAQTAAPEPASSAVAPSDSGWKPNDPRYAEQWNFRMVDAEQAWASARGKGITVAVIDTGVAYADTRHGKQAEDFRETKFAPGRNFVHSDSEPGDDHGHGTHVAGTIAESTNNGIGAAGLAFESRIMPIKVLSKEGYGNAPNIAEGIRWAADHGAGVINMSLGSPVPDTTIRRACEYAHSKGSVIVCAAGNSGREGVGYPAAFRDCIAVSSVGPTGDLSYFSSWGRQVAVAAPGGDKMAGGDAGGILQNTIIANEDGDMVDGYYSFQGTSMASPHVAAVAALIESRGEKDPDAVRFALTRSAKTAGDPAKFGAGIVNAGAAVNLAGEILSDRAARLWIVTVLFAGCGILGIVRRRAGSTMGAPVWGTVALSAGLLLPDWMTRTVGYSSTWNILGHSVLIPAAFVLSGARHEEKRFAGWLAAGIAAHLAWEGIHGTAPLAILSSPAAALPWIAVNAVVGTGILLSALNERPRD